MLELAGSKPLMTEADIKNVAVKLSISIPDDMLAFYLSNNGGYCERNTFFINDEGYKVNEFLSFGTGSDSIEETYKEVFLGNEEMPKNFIPFAVDAGGDYFCFDVSKSGFGRIMFFESEYYDDPERSIVFLSETFSEFVDGLDFDR